MDFYGVAGAPAASRGVGVCHIKCSHVGLMAAIRGRVT